MKAHSVWVAILIMLLANIPLIVTAQNTSPSWQSSTPEEQGFDSIKLAEGLLAFRQNNLNIHSLLLIRNDKLILDAYFYPYDGQTVHNLASVTKTVMTTLIGIAADQGKLSLDDPLLSFFPDRPIANRDAMKERITVGHLASMSSGLDCTSDYDEATLKEMFNSPDYVQFVLDRKVMWEPGTHFVYCSPGMHLLSAILQQATGITTLDFARQYLFEPLGIQDLIWESDPQGYTHGWGDLYLHPHDAAKLGYLWLNQGVWEGQQIVSREWVEESVKVQITTENEGDDYGYGWWIARDSFQSYSAQGRGGQRVTVIPSLNAVLTFTGGGVEEGDISPALAAALVDITNPLPANPAGMAQLETALATVLAPPTPQAVALLSETAQTISGQTFVLEPNPGRLENIRLDFDDSAEAWLYFTPTGGTLMPPLPVGLDGVYRLVPGEYDLPQGMRGYWMDDQTFLLEQDQIANNEHILFQMHFEGNYVTIKVHQMSHEVELTIEGTLQEPM